MVPCIVQRMVVETPLFMVVIMASFTVRRIRAWTWVFMVSIMESCTSGETIYPMT
ncbi:MAG: hypothetical protein NTX53_01815 [candidate division WOR-3 bacterium]|nr:hypothetical protein [candidate division WOR-3 bacterium]